MEYWRMRCFGQWPYPPQFFKGKIIKEKYFLLLRQYEEEMLDAFLQEDDYSPELLRYCNILYEMLPTILTASHLRAEKDARKLAAIAMVAAGYGGEWDGRDEKVTGPTENRRERWLIDRKNYGREYNQ